MQKIKISFNFLVNKAIESLMATMIEIMANTYGNKDALYFCSWHAKSIEYSSI